MHVSFWNSVFVFKYIPRSKISGPYGNSIFRFLRNLNNIFPQWLCQFTFPLSVYKGSLFSSSLPICAICGLFEDSHSNRCKVIFHCDFDFHFQMISSVEHLSVCLLSICMFSLKKYLFNSSAHFQLSCFSYAELYDLLTYFEY